MDPDGERWRLRDEDPKDLFPEPPVVETGP
jgi:hypothetical protein